MKSQPTLEALEDKQVDDVRAKKATSCTLCNAVFDHVLRQREHARSDWHGYNLKRKLKGQAIVNELEFEDLVKERLDESISGSDTSDSENEEEETEGMLQAISKKETVSQQYLTSASTASRNGEKVINRSPLIWFLSPLLPPKALLGAYRALFDGPEQEGTGTVEALRNQQLGTVQNQSTLVAPKPPVMFLCMVGGGHFAAMIVSLMPKVIKRSNGVEERQAIVVSHRTFHRYTTRRKQGGSQSANDSAKGAAHSAGAGIRRHNEAALSSEIRALLADWKTMISQCRLLFVRATGSTNRRTLFGPYEDQVLSRSDPRIRYFPFTTRRATQAELMRAFIELTRVKIKEVEQTSSSPPKIEREESTSHLSYPSIDHSQRMTTAQTSKEEEIAMLHTSQLQGLVRRSKAPDVIAYLSDNSLSPDFAFCPQTTQSYHHAPTLLHLASSVNASAVILSLLTKAGANPTIHNGEGKVPFDIAGDRSTRDAFRVARSELGEGRWNWEEAHCPPPMSRTEASCRGETEREEADMVESARRKLATKNLESERHVRGPSTIPTPQKLLAGAELSAAERREQEARGMKPEFRARMEREKRARAAEQRMGQMSQK